MVKLVGVYLERFTTSYLKACDSSKSQIVTLMDEMQQILIDSGVAKKIRLQPKCVGVHPKNRGGNKMSPLAMNARGGKIISVGFSPKLCNVDRCWAFQEGDGKHIHKRMAELTASSPMFSCLEDEYLGGSVGSGHLNQWLGAVNAERPCCETKWKTDGGVWNKAALIANDAQLADYQSEGLWWWLVDKSVEVAFPQIPVIFERALNTEHHIGVGETFDQMFVQVRAKAMSNTADGGPPDYETVAREIGKTQPPCISDLEAHIDFLRKWGGGPQNGFKFAEETSEYMQLRMPHARHISGGIFRALACIKATPHEMFPRVVHGMLKANASCSDSLCVDNVGQLITVTDVRSMQHPKRRAEVLAAEQILNRVRDVWATLKPDSDSGVEIGDLDVAIVTALVGKDADKRTVAEVADAFFQDYFGEKKAQPEASRTSAGADHIEFSGGQATNAGHITMTNLGFTVGTLVAEKMSNVRDQQFIVAYVNADGSMGLNRVRADGSTDTAVVVVAMDDATHKWNPLDKHQRLQLDQRMTTKRADHPIVQAMAAAVSMALYHSMQSDFDDLLFQTSPVKRLIALSGAKKGKLTLTPYGKPTVPICTRGHSEGQGQAVVVTVKVGDQGFIFNTVKDESKTNFTPYYMVQTTQDATKVNMVVETLEIDMPIKLEKRESATVIVQVLTNCKRVEPNDELIMMLRVEAKAPKRAPQVAVMSVDVNRGAGKKSKK